jgi:hypothetical protein
MSSILGRMTYTLRTTATISHTTTANITTATISHATTIDHHLHPHNNSNHWAYNSEQVLRKHM